MCAIGTEGSSLFFMIEQQQRTLYRLDKKKGGKHVIIISHGNFLRPLGRTRFLQITITNRLRKGHCSMYCVRTNVRISFNRSPSQDAHAYIHMQYIQYTRVFGCLITWLCVFSSYILCLRHRERGLLNLRCWDEISRVITKFGTNLSASNNREFNDPPAPPPLLPFLCDRRSPPGMYL